MKITVKDFFQDLGKRIKADWHEWSMYQRIVWVERFKQRRARRDTLREKNLIDAAIERARLKNADDHKTYYIIRDQWGGINELNNEEIANLTRKKILPRMNYLQRITEAIAIVTSNRYDQLNFDRKHKNQKHDEQSHNGEDR